MSERLCVVMPVYNEREAIGAVLKKWDAALSALGIDYEIRPYNDGSRDDSLQVMRGIAPSLKSVSVRDKPNGGHGNTILTGYREAASDGFDWVFQIDSDDEMGPERFNELWSRRNDFDFLVGIRGGRVQALPRKIISLVSRLCVRLFYGKSIWDVNTPYRLMRMSVFKEFFALIPMDTFAPNVILSGLAAVHNIRCFETRVPQHDRMTGEVSIKKWKLFKAACRSFWQTICFSLKNKCLGAIRYSDLSGAIISIVLCALMISTLDYVCFPWCDEVCTTDTAANICLHGVWNSYIWPYSYNPLHLQLLTAWVWVFGVSHMSVCSFGCFLALILFFVIQRVLIRRGFLGGVFENIFFAVLFWGAWRFGAIIRMGRIDILAAIFTVLTVDALMPIKDGVIHKGKLFLWSSFMMLSAVYPVPAVVVFGLMLFFTARGANMRKEIFRAGIVAFCGVLLAWLLSCGYYLYHGQLIRFLNSYFSFNSTLSGHVSASFADRCGKAYLYDIEALLLYVLSLVVILILPKVRNRIAFKYVLFAGFIPLVCVCAGRYTVYYSWLLFLPVLVLTSWIVHELAWKKTEIMVLIVLSCAIPVAYVYSNLETWEKRNAEKAQAEKYIEERLPYLQPGSDVQITNWNYYYPLVNARFKIWVEPKLIGWDGVRTPSDKFHAAAKRIKSDKIREMAIKIFERIERRYQVEPGEGCVKF